MLFTPQKLQYSSNAESHQQNALQGVIQVRASVPLAGPPTTWPSAQVLGVWHLAPIRDLLHRHYSPLLDENAGLYSWKSVLFKTILWVHKSWRWVIPKVMSEASICVVNAGPIVNGDLLLRRFCWSCCHLIVLCMVYSSKTTRVALNQILCLYL